MKQDNLFFGVPLFEEQGKVLKTALSIFILAVLHYELRINSFSIIS